MGRSKQIAKQLSFRPRKGISFPEPVPAFELQALVLLKSGDSVFLNSRGRLFILAATGNTVCNLMSQHFLSEQNMLDRWSYFRSHSCSEGTTAICSTHPREKGGNFVEAKRSKESLSNLSETTVKILASDDKVLQKSCAIALTYVSFSF